MATSATATATLPGLPAAGPGGALTTTAGDAAGAPAAPTGPLARLLSPTGPFGPVRQVIDQPAVRKAMPFLIVAVVIMLFAAIYLAINAPNYRSITAGMSEADTQAALEALKQLRPKADVERLRGITLS